MKMKSTCRIRNKQLLVVLFMCLTSVLFSQRKLIWKGTVDNNGAMTTNYTIILANPGDPNPLNITASDSLYFTEGNLTAQHHALIQFPLGMPAAKIVVTNNATNTPYNLFFKSYNAASPSVGVKLYDKLLVNGNLAHKLLGESDVNNLSLSHTSNLLARSLEVYGDVEILNPNVLIEKVNITCRGKSGVSNVVNIPQMVFDNGYLMFDVDQAYTQAGTVYSLSQDLVVNRVKMFFTNGSFSSNGHLIRTEFNGNIGGNFNHSALLFNISGVGGKTGVINLSNSKIISKGDLTIFAYSPSGTTYNFLDTELELHSANFLVSQLPAGSGVASAAQRFYFNGFKSISFLSDGLDGDASYYLLDGVGYFSSISSKKVVIDRPIFEFKGSGADVTPASQTYFYTDTLMITANTKEIGFQQEAPPWRFKNVIAPTSTSCASTLLFRNIPSVGNSSQRGKIALGSLVSISHLSVRSLSVSQLPSTTANLTAGYNLGNNATPFLTYAPVATKIFYWTLGGANSNWHDANNWSIGTVSTYPTNATTNPGGCLPTINDSVVFQMGLSNVTIQSNLVGYCKGMNWISSGAINGGGKLHISGDYNATTAVSVSVPTTFVLAGTRTIKSSAGVFADVEFGHTGEYKLLDSLNCKIVNHYSGTFNTNRQNVTMDKYMHPYDAYWTNYLGGFQARSLIIKNSTINVRLQDPWTAWNDQFTLSADSSKIRLLQSSASINFKILSVSNSTMQTYWNIDVVSNPNFLSTISSSINLKFNHLRFTGNANLVGAGVGSTWTIDSMYFTKNYTYNFNALNNMILTGHWVVPTIPCGGMTFFNGSTNAILRINASQIQNVQECMFTRIDASLGAVFNVTDGVDNGGNVNVNFLLGGGKTFYWRGGNPNNANTNVSIGGVPFTNIDWDNGRNWAINNQTDFQPLILSNPSACIPGPADSVVFDGQSFAAGVGTSVKINSVSFCRDIVWLPSSVATTIPTFNFDSKRLNVYGSLIFTNGMRFNGPSIPIYFLASAGTNATIDFGGIQPLTTPNTFIGAGGDLYFNGSGNFVFQSDIPFRYIVHQNGNLTTNSFELNGGVFGSYSSVLSAITGSSRQIDFGSSTLNLIYGTRVFQMDYLDLTAMNASNLSIVSNATNGAGEFRNIRIESATITPVYKFVKNVSSSFSNKSNNGPAIYPPGSSNTSDIRHVISGNSPSIRVNKLEYQANSSTNTYGNFEIDTLILGAVNNFYNNSRYKINDTVITNGVTCRNTVIRGGLEYTHHSTPTTTVNGSSVFVSPTCDLHLQNVNMSSILADVSSCGNPADYWYSETDGGNNTNWIFSATQVTVSNDTLQLSCTDLPETLYTPAHYGNAGISTLWNTGATTDSIVVTLPGQYIISVGYGGGCVLSDTFNIIVTDTVPPALTCLQDTTFFADANCSSLVPDFTTNPLIQVVDDCSQSNLVTITQMPLAGTAIGLGATTVFVFAEDESGNRDSCSFVINVRDTLSPIIADCPSDTTVILPLGLCSVNVNWDVPIASDNCTSFTLSSTAASGDTFNTGITNVTYTVVDDAGNSATCMFVVTVVENQPPIFTSCPPAIIVNTDAGVCGANVTWNAPQATDNCGVPVLTSTVNSGDFFPLGTTTVVIVATDNSGLTDTCQFDVVVNDTENPVISISSISQNLCVGSPASWVEQITDNCTIDTIIVSHVNGSVFPVGSTIVTYTAIDVAGNSSTYDFTIVVSEQGPAVDLATSQQVCVGSAATLSVVNPNNTYNYEWYHNGQLVGTGVTYTIQSTQQNQQGNYTVIPASTNGCPQLSDSILLIVDACGIVIPEIFTPNGDADNGVFYIENLEQYPNSKVWIHNRWGALVFQSDDYNNDWNGNSQSNLNVNGDQLPEGTFYYVLQLGGNETQANSGEIFKGFVYLKR